MDPSPDREKGGKPGSGCGVVGPDWMIRGRHDAAASRVLLTQESPDARVARQWA